MWLHLRRLLLFVVMLMNSTNANAQFIASAKADKYHKESCQHAKRISEENRVEFSTIEEAKEAGYIACKVCKPASDSTAANRELKSIDNQEALGGRCQATTKKGTQCKRSAQEGSQYCWQHAR